MEDFPITRPIARAYYSELIYKKQQRSDFENGAVQTRPVFTRKKMKWTIGWKNLSDDEYDLLKEFFERNIGKKFLWTDFKGVSHTVCFSKDVLDGITPIGFRENQNVWDTGKIEIEERL